MSASTMVRGGHGESPEAFFHKSIDEALLLRRGAAGGDAGWQRHGHNRAFLAIWRPRRKVSQKQANLTYRQNLHHG